MDYLLLFMEGIMTFISPCLLPMIPLYIAFFASGKEESTRSTLLKAVMFISGFSIVFIIMSLFVSTVGSFFLQNRQLVNILAGLIMIIMGLDYTTGQKLMSYLTPKGVGRRTKHPFLFGIVFAISWTPCVGTFLASALTYIASVATSWTSFLLIFSYCLGLGIPFLLCALLVEESKKVIGVIKKHFHLINMLSGLFLIMFGLVTMFGVLERLLLGLS